MGATPDRFPGAREDEEVILDDRTADGDPTSTGALRYVGGSFRLRDALGVFNPRSGGFNVGTDVDFLLENSPPEPDNAYSVTRTAGVVTREEWKRGDNTLIKRIDYTRTGGSIDTEIRKVFGSDGSTIVGQLSISYTRSGGQVTGATRTRVV